MRAGARTIGSVAARGFVPPAAPLSIRTVRLLLMLEAGLLILSGLFAALIGIVLGPGNAIPFAGGEVSGGGAVGLGLLYGVFGVAATYIAVELRRLPAWTRVAAIVLQAVLIVLFLARGDFSGSLGISLALCLAISALMLSPSAGTALARTTTAPARPVTPPTSTADR